MPINRLKDTIMVSIAKQHTRCVSSGVDRSRFEIIVKCRDFVKLHQVFCCT